MVWVLFAAAAAAATIAGVAVLLCRGAKNGSVRFAKHSSAWKKGFLVSFLITGRVLRKKNGKGKK